MTPVEILRLRTRRLTRHPVATGDYVLCWLQQALRAEENPALDAAIAAGNAQGLPVVVVHTLENRYPHASARLHRFILEASRDLEAGSEARGLRFARYVRRDTPGASGTVDVIARLAERAAAVVLGDVPTFVTRTYAERLAERIPRAVFAVDARCAVPMNAFDRHHRTTKGFRAAHTPQRVLHLGTDLRQTPQVESFAGDLEMEHVRLGENLDALIATCGVDQSVRPVARWNGARSAALARLDEAVRTIVPRYKWTRNNPALERSTAEISPWLHFGVLSPREVANAVLEAEERGDLHPAARWKFLDETLTWREYYHHRCRHEPDVSRWSGLPKWARETMSAHASDPRPCLYSLDELIHGETVDTVWNAAQKQFLADGWLHNNLRMYWVKQILRWRQDPREAWAAACYLNDRLSYDGRDASTYGGIRWGFGESKPYAEKPIYGAVSRKTSGALMRRDGVRAWITREATREVPRVNVPEDDVAFAPYL
ncbi:MAG: deoxyribodipyrimidine photo-lyase [Bacteroidota bacterium]